MEGAGLRASVAASAHAGWSPGAGSSMGDQKAPPRDALRLHRALYCNDLAIVKYVRLTG